MTTVTTTRRTGFVTLVAVMLLCELVGGSALAVNASGASRPPPPPRIAVVGDTFSAGAGNTVVWPTLLARHTGWPVANFALPDTGFVADGAGGHAFTYQVDRALASGADVVLVVGGVSDTGYADTEAIRLGAIDALNKIIRSGRRALVIGPTWYETPVPFAVQRVSGAIRQAAVETGTPFLAALDPPWLTTELMASDLASPTDEGQSVVADTISAWLAVEVGR